MDGLEWKIQLKWMIWGYRYFWKHPFVKKKWLPFFLAQPNEGGAVDCAAEIAAAKPTGEPPRWEGFLRWKTTLGVSRGGVNGQWR